MIRASRLGRDASWTASALLFTALAFASSSLASPTTPAPTGLWVGNVEFGPPVHGELQLELSGSHRRAEIAGRSARVDVARDSVQFALPDGSARFLGRLSADRRDIRGFWIQSAPALGAAHSSDEGRGPYDQAYATPILLARAAEGRYRGLVVPLETRFTLYLDVWPDSAGSWRAAFRNPQFNLNGGAGRYRLNVRGDSLDFVAMFQDAPEIRLHALWDRVHSRIRMPWNGIASQIVLTPGGRADSAGFWPRMPRGRIASYRAPGADHDGWETAPAASVGMDESALARFTQAIADTDPSASRAPLIHSCLIERHGRLIYEEYFFGFDREQTHDLRSAAKTFASILVGAAMRGGLPIAPESTLFSMPPGRGTYANPDPRKAAITLGHLMTHTSGLSCDDNDDASPGNEGTMQGSSVDWWQYMLDLPMAFDPGIHYAYCSGGMNLVGAALSAVTGRWIPEYFDSTIARPLGFRRFHYNLMPGGEGYLGGGVHLRPRDLLKLGRLYLDGGVWQGRRIVDSSWVRRSISHLVDGPYSADGYAWHLNTLKSGGREYREFEANGNGGQLLMVLPELDMSIVFTAGNYQAGGIWSRFRNELVPQRIIPAVLEP
jgi:CubicO group peptidase (beta-lactamase class C family)